ncbi:MAG TPA: cohesin domain-containing protein [Bryobacteraceae bacterium]|nr:cohesin domain-containing protein [Bryobacteraceae bacterium]
MTNLKVNSRATRRPLAILSVFLFAASVWGATKGPDAEGYTASDQTVFSYFDLSGAGGGTAILAGTDDGTAFLTLPFSFQFYGVSYTGICVSSNGAAYFTPDAATCSSIVDFANVDLSSAATPSDLPAVLPFWTDLTFATPGAGAIYYQGFGTAGSRRFVIQWANAYAANSTSPVNFEIVLSEGTNAISLQYQTVNLGAGDPATNGGTATVGIHNTGGQASNRQIAWSFDVPVLSDGYALSLQSNGPGQPMLTSPSNEATGVSVPVTLSWNAAANATSYDVYLGTSNSPPLVTNVTGTSYQAESLAGTTTYYWRIIAKNASGSSASALFKFTTAAGAAGSNVITFAQPADTPISGGSITLTATASSGLTVTYLSNTSSVCTVTSAGVVTFASVGACSITANQAGNGNFAAAEAVTRTFNVTLNPNVITFPQPADTPLTSGPVTMTATATSGLAVSYASNSTAVCTAAGGAAVSLVSAGTCSITASQSASGNFAAAASVTRTFNVTKGTLNIIFPQPPDTPLSAGSVTLTATAAPSNLLVSLTSNSTSVCTVSGFTATLVAAGTCSITASQGGDANYNAATSVDRTFMVTPGGGAALTLAVGDGNGFAGDVVEIPIQLTSVGTPTAASFQLDLAFDQAELTYKSSRVGEQLSAAGKTIDTSTQPNGNIRIIGVGLNQNVIANGPVAYVSFTLASPFSPSTVTPSGCTASDAEGSVLVAVCTAGTIRLPSCDINADGTTNVADVQLVINEALGVTPSVHDLNHDGSVNVADVQKVINAALGLGCSVQ